MRSVMEGFSGWGMEFAEELGPKGLEERLVTEGLIAKGLIKAELLMRGTIEERV
jgi:hypothetical protein